MRHHTALQHGEGGPWHYVSVGKRGGGPIGYCTEACAHQTADEAFAHYREYVLDNLNVGAMSNQQLRCEVPDCGEWTQRMVNEPDGYGNHIVCDRHGDDRAVYAEHFYPVGEKRESWQS